MLAAAVPAVAEVGALLLVARRTRTVAVRPLLAAFAAGAVGAAWLAAALNHLLLASAAGPVVPVLGAPLVEEAAKALAIVLVALVWRHLLATMPAAILVGATVGVGFATSENVDYLTLAAVQGGPGGLARALWLRSLLGALVHAVFAATTAAGLAWGVERWRGSWALLGFGAAVAQHVAWNGLAADAITDVLCNATRPGGPCGDAPDATDVLVSVPLVAVAALGPGVAALALLVRRAARGSAAPQSADRL